MWLLIVQRVLLDAILDLLYFPLWWYTGGVVHSIRWCADFFRDGNRTLAPGLWLKNLFVPMFGQYDWQGRIISFFMRSVQLIFRSIALLFWFFICASLFLVWLILPAIICLGFVRSFLR